MLTKRILNIAKRMTSGEMFWSKSSPRMTRKEYQQLHALGFPIGGDQGWGNIAGSGEYTYYMYDMKDAQSVLERLLTKHAPDVAKATAQKGVLHKNRSGKRAGVA